MTNHATKQGTQKASTEPDNFGFVKLEKDDPMPDHHGINNEDPACKASLLASTPHGVFTNPYPLTDHEPPELTLTRESAAALASGKEDTDPLDYNKVVHELVAAPVAYYSTDQTMHAEAVVKETLRDAQAAQYVLEKEHGTCLYRGVPDEVRQGADRVRALEEAARQAAQSRVLHAERHRVTFDAADNTFVVEAEYCNRAGAPASVTINLPRTKGLTLADVDVDIHGYSNNSAYRPIEQAKKIFEEASASSNKSASIQAMDKFHHTVTVKIPAYRGVNDSNIEDRDGEPATFTARFRLACDDVEDTALRLPTPQIGPIMEAYDFAVLPPPCVGGKSIPFELRILPSPGTSELSLPSRASAALDADRRGVPTYWVKPPAKDEEVTEHTFLFMTPSLQPPCFRFRFVNESDGDFYAVTGAMKNARLDSGLASAKVLCYAPTSDTECVALVEACAPKCRADPSDAPGVDKHVVIVCDESGSMESYVKGSSVTCRVTATKQVAVVCERLQSLPRVFSESKICSKNDKFFLSIVGFHSTASVVCSRVPIVPGCDESKRALAAAAEAVCRRTETGGTQYTSWALAAQGLVAESDHVALALFTDGALWDRSSFEPEYDKLKTSVNEFEACAIGCGQWANHSTVKLVATPGGGEALVERFDSTMSSEAMRLIGKCVASMATKYTIVAEDFILAHKGCSADAPRFVRNFLHPHGHDSVYEVGLGGKRVFAVTGSYSGSTVKVCGMAQVDAPHFSYKVEVDGTSVPRDVMRVLRHIDPLFTANDVEMYKCPNAGDLLSQLREGIGVYNQTTTSNVVKVAEYDLGHKHDHSLDSRTRAVVPSLEERTRVHTRDGPPAWLRPVPQDHTPPNAVTEYSRAPHHQRHDFEEAPYGLHDSMNDCEPAFRSLSGADDAADEPVNRSLSADPPSSSPPPAARSTSAADIPPPAAKRTKGEVEKPTDNNVVPTFSDLANCALYKNDYLLPYLNDHTIAYRALDDLLLELQKVKDQMIAARGGRRAPNEDVVMDDVVSAALAEVAGPSLTDVVAALGPLASALCAFVLRYQLPVDIGSMPARASFTEAGVDYFIKVANKLREIVRPYRVMLWRAKLVTTPLEPDQLTFKGTLTWVAEDRARVHCDYVKDIISPVLDTVACVFSNAFTLGGYLGGTFVSENHLYTNPEPPRPLVDHLFRLESPFIVGQHFDQKFAYEAVGPSLKKSY